MRRYIQPRELYSSQAYEVSCFLYSDINQMGYRRYRLLLQNGRRTEQRSGSREQDIMILSPAHIPQDMTAQHRGTASASGAAGVYILLLVKDHYTAVPMLWFKLDPLLPHQII